jgi:hypothetical protein
LNLRHYVDVSADTATADWTVYYRPTGTAAVLRGSGDVYHIGSGVLNAASTFTCGDGPVPFLGFVGAVTLHYRCSVDDTAGAPDFTIGLFRGGVGLTVTTVTPTTSWQYGEVRLTTDPVSAIRFVGADLADLGIGVVVTTAPTTGEIRISELWLEVEWVATPEHYDPVDGALPDAVTGELAWSALGAQTVALVSDRLQITNTVPTGWRNYMLASRRYGHQYNTEVCTRLHITGAPAGFAQCIACVDDGARNIKLCAFSALLNRRIGLIDGTLNASDEAQYFASTDVDWTLSHHYRLVVDRDADVSSSSNVRVYVDYDDVPVLDVRYTEFGELYDNVVLWFGSGADEYAPLWAVTTADITQAWHFIVTTGVDYVVDWGDGTVDVFTGTGVLQTHNYNYGGAGTYAIKVYVEDPVELLDLRAYNNALVGTLPDLSRNTAITIFSNSNNLLTGSIPDLSSNVALQYFIVRTNQLTGTIPSIATNVALLEFNVSDNQLTGVIPNLTTNVALTTFSVYSNLLTGSIPDLTTNVALTHIHVHDNQLTGVIPSLTTNVALQYIDAHTNQLTGNIPDLSANVAMTICHLYDNQLTGNIPDLSANVALEDFYCYDNQLTGYVASTISITLNDFQAQNNALDLAAVDQILADFTFNAAARPLGGTIDLSGGTNAVPTPAVKAACLLALQTAPWAWTITTN